VNDVDVENPNDARVSYGLV